jgi:hypothetical protein
MSGGALTSGCNDRFFLLTDLCGRKDADHPWLFDRWCTNGQAEWKL